MAASVVTHDGRCKWCAEIHSDTNICVIETTIHTQLITNIKIQGLRAKGGRPRADRREERGTRAESSRTRPLSASPHASPLHPLTPRAEQGRALERGDESMREVSRRGQDQ